MHYQRWRAHGNPGPATRQRKVKGSESPPCSVGDCDRPATSQTYCELHYRRWLHNGAPDAFAPRPVPTGRQLEALAAGRSLPRERMDPAERLRRDRQCSREWARRWRSENPDEARRVRREHMASYGPEYRRKWNHYNRLRRLDQATPDELSNEYALILAGDPCCYCGAPMKHVDHIHPIARGGSGSWDNLTAACASCNHQKSARPLLHFMLDRVSA